MLTNKYDIQTSASPSGCTVENFPDTPYQNYRYFNQPIEQIPGWDADEPQILFHGKNAGLVWVNIECVPVVTCAEISPSGTPSSGECNCELTLTRHNLYVLKDAGVNTEDCAGAVTASVSMKYIFNPESSEWIPINSTT